MAALAVVPLIGKILDRVIPDKQANDAAKQHLAELTVTGELAQITGQLDIDKAEASSSSAFVAGWRPAIGWVCALGLMSQFIVRPFVIAFMHRPDFPQLDLSTLMTLVFAMLGIGVHEKLTS